MRPLPDYVPNDQPRHLTEWPSRVASEEDAWTEWEHAHNHSPRTGCYFAHGCRALVNHHEWLEEAIEDLHRAVLLITDESDEESWNSELIFVADEYTRLLNREDDR